MKTQEPPSQIVRTRVMILYFLSKPSLWKIAQIQSDSGVLRRKAGQRLCILGGGVCASCGT